MIPVLSEYWAVFAVGAAIEVWLVRRLRRMRLQRGRRFPLRWIVWTAAGASCLTLALGMESFLATARAYQTIGEGAQADFVDDVRGHLGRAWPLFAGLGAVLAGLVRHPRSEAVTAGLVATAGVLISWGLAVWLSLTHHQEAAFRVLVLLPGGLGVVASLVGFTAATSLWMAIGRWLWRWEWPQQRSRHA